MKRKIFLLVSILAIFSISVCIIVTFSKAKQASKMVGTANEIKERYLERTKITYYDEKEQIFMYVEDGQIFTQNLAINYNQGIATIKEKNDPKYRTYDGKEVLADGEYTIQIEAGEEIVRRTFIIDTKAPTVVNLKRVMHAGEKIKFLDEDLTKAVLINSKGKEFIIRDLTNKEQSIDNIVNNEYTLDIPVDENGYRLELEDRVGKAHLTTRTFKVIE